MWKSNPIPFSSKRARIPAISTIKSHSSSSDDEDSSPSSPSSTQSNPTASLPAQLMHLIDMLESSILDSRDRGVGIDPVCQIIRSAAEQIHNLQPEQHSVRPSSFPAPQGVAKPPQSSNTQPNLASASTQFRPAPATKPGVGWADTKENK